MTFPDADPENFRLKSLRILGSTGEPWTEEAWQWFFAKVGKKKLPIINYSGGTEISGGILASYPIHKIPPCAFTGVLPGINADVVDEKGKPVRNRVGELVIKGPWNGITRGFFNEPERFEQTYFSRFGPDLWAHGDWAKIDENGYWYILGRSDDTIKVAGKRLGPAEVENIVNALPEIAESAAFGVPHPIKGEALVVVAVPSKTDFVKEELIQKIKNQIATKLSKALSPEDVLIVKALPKTRNGKILRRLIRESYLGEVKSDTSSLENPQALAEIRRERRE
jgi:acetyl-CoA synthetase